jgi:mitochondrial chaperone BCS1
MIEIFNQYFNDFNSFTKSNPVVSGIIGLWGLGVVTYFLKEIPQKIIEIIKEQFTVTLYLSCRDEAYYHFLRWYQVKGYSAKARGLKLNDSGSTYNDTILSAGYGQHYFFYKNYPFRLIRRKETNTGLRNIKEEIIILTIGRSQKRILDIIADITPKPDKKKLTKVMKWTDDHGWHFSFEQKSRQLDSVILSDQNQSFLRKSLDRFKSDKTWYEEHGIPYRMGICLYGPPGTGKTSLVKAIAAEEEKDLYLLNLNSMNDLTLQNAMDQLDHNAIVLIEDIDAYFFTHKRDENNKDNLSGKTLSGLLNAIDGVSNSKGRILVITTNHIEKLDPALLRPGRIDLSLELGYMTDETARKALRKFFPAEEVNHISIKPRLTPAEFQNLVCQYKERPEMILKLISNKSSSPIEEIGPMIPEGSKPRNSRQKEEFMKEHTD